MTDNIIINIISKTYFIIVSFFSFIILFLILIFIIFQHGLYLDNLHFSNIYIKKTHIIWNNGLNIISDEIILTKSDNKHTTALTLKKIDKYIRLLSKTQSLIEKVSVKKITAPNFHATFSYIPDSNGSLTLNYDNYTLKSNINLKDNIVQLNIKNLRDINNTIQINGEVFLNALTNKIYAKINTIVNKDLNTTTFIVSDSKSLHYTLISHNPVKNVKYLLGRIPLDSNLKYWVHDAIETKNVTVKYCYGKIDFNHLKDAYKYLHAKIEAEHLSYKYNPELDPVVSQKTIIEFQKGILFIKPIEAYSYNTYLKNSWLKIDFTQKHVWLDLYLLLDGKLNNDILSILQAYKITLPFKQTKGIVNTNLQIGVDLQTIKTEVEGDFFTNNSEFNFMGLNLHATHAKVHLHNTKVTTNSLLINYKNILETNATLVYDAKQNKGSINFIVNELNISNVILSSDRKPLQAVYTIDNNNSVLDINASKWSFLNQTIYLDPFSFVLNVHNLLLNISPVLFSVNNVAKGYVGGMIDVNDKKADLDIDLLNFNFGGVILDQTNAPFKVTYNKTLNIKSINDIYLRVNGSPYKIKNAAAVMNSTDVKLKHTVVEVGDFITTKIYAKYNYKTNKAHLSLNHFVLKNPKTGKALYKNSKILLQAHIKDKHIEIKSRELDAEFYSDAYLWKLNMYSLGRIAKNAPLLKNLQLTKGEVSLYKKSNEDETQFKAKIMYPYALIFQNKKPIKEYKITGRIKKDLSIYLNINDNIKVKINDKTKISCKHVGINLNEVIRLVSDLESANTSKEGTSTLFLNATDSYIYLSKKRKALADKIYLQYADNILTAQLRYKKGNAGFRLQKNNFHLYGNNFNDTFMQNLFSLAKFKGGHLDFSMGGTLEDYDGVFYITKTTLMDYKLLNNVLAFINTIPSLVTFSLPNYDKDGLKIKNGYIKFHYKDNIFNISDLYLNSKELEILGKGKANIKDDTIDLTMNLKTDLASNISKIPLVGYIVFDGKSISTTLEVSGKLHNPKITTQVAQDIAVAPLNIIKRTLTLPYKLIQKAVNDINTSK